MAQLEAVQAIAILCLLAGLIQYRFAQLLPAPVCPKTNQFCNLCVTVVCTGLPKDKAVRPFSPLVAYTGLPKDEVINSVMSLSQLAPAPVYPKTKLFGLKGWSKGPARALSMVRLDVHQNGMRHVA